jgi:hypothetical protein
MFCNMKAISLHALVSTIAIGSKFLVIDHSQLWTPMVQQRKKFLSIQIEEQMYDDENKE